jgi:hypothetical protein
MITITIAPTGTGQVTATASDGHARRTTAPLLDGARYWLEKGANPNTPIATVWSSAPPARACLTPRGGGTPFRCDRLKELLQRVVALSRRRPSAAAKNGCPPAERVPPEASRRLRYRAFRKRTVSRKPTDCKAR